MSLTAVGAALVEEGHGEAGVRAACECVAAWVVAWVVAWVATWVEEGAAGRQPAEASALAAAHGLAVQVQAAVVREGGLRGQAGARPGARAAEVRAVEDWRRLQGEGEL